MTRRAPHLARNVLTTKRATLSQSGYFARTCGSQNPAAESTQRYLPISTDRLTSSP
jgi:hypothetical protein